MLGSTPGVPSRQPAADPLQAYIRKLVEPHTVPGASADEAALLQVVDEVTAAQMRAILHHPAFQAVEAAWRVLALLVRRLDTDDKIKLCLLDVLFDELATDLKAADLSTSRTYRVLVEQPLGTPGGVPWAVVVGNYTFAPTVADAVLASRLAHLSQAASAPFLAGAHALFLGCASLAATPDPRDWKQGPDPKGSELWQALRQLPQAAYLGLALPRFLVRQPYGAEGSDAECFAFEEMIPEADHEAYLWGNSAFACALLLGQAYEHMGWRLRPGVVEDVDGLPTWVRKVDGDRALLPCGETLLLDRAADALRKRGLIAVQSIQGRDAIRIAQFPSLADPPQPLAGRWHR
jgi:type VI secretion system protein ImpC